MPCCSCSCGCCSCGGCNCWGEHRRAGGHRRSRLPAKATGRGARRGGNGSVFKVEECGLNASRQWVTSSRSQDSRQASDHGTENVWVRSTVESIADDRWMSDGCLVAIAIACDWNRVPSLDSDGGILDKQGLTLLYLMDRSTIHRQLLRPWIEEEGGDIHPSIHPSIHYIRYPSTRAPAQAAGPATPLQQRQPGIDRPTVNDGGRGVSGAGPHGPRAGGLCRPGHLHAGAWIDAGMRASDGWDGMGWWGKVGWPRDSQPH